MLQILMSWLNYLSELPMSIPGFSQLSYGRARVCWPSIIIGLLWNIDSL